MSLSPSYPWAADGVFETLVPTITPDFTSEPPEDLETFTTTGASVKTILRHLQRARTDFFGIYEGVTGSMMDNILDICEKRSNLSKLKMSYHADSLKLIVVMPGGEHEVGHTRFFQHLLDWAVQYQLHMQFHSIGVKDFVPSGVTYSRRGKQADTAIKVTTRNRGSDLPNFVVEVGVSEPYSALVQDAKFWLEKIGVQVVILISINRANQSALWERWELARPVHVTRSNRGIPTCMGRTNITYSPNATDVNPSVPFIICTFGQLFDRAPIPPEPILVEFDIGRIRDWAYLVFGTTQ